MSTENTTKAGIGFPALLGLAFIILKLCKVVDWSWWVVLAPFWLPVGVFVVGFLIWLIYIIIYKK